jgi:drug/metabolite transporter (DMT)-like permease
MQNDLRRGAIYALYAAVAFSVMGICIKAVPNDTPNEVVVFIRCFVGLLALLPWALRNGAASIRTRRLGGHLIRAGFGVLAMYAFFYAIAHLPLAVAMLLTYSTPLWVPFIAWAWIQERPPLIVLPAVLLGIAGIALIVKPGSLEMNWTAGIIGIGSGVLAGCAMVGIRRITDTEPAPRIVFYFALLSSVISAIPLSWSWQTPGWQALALLVAAGISATIGQLNLTRAYSCAPAARIGPFTYATVVFSALLAWLLWGEALDRWSILGSMLVITTCVLVSWRRSEPTMEE